MGCSLSTLLATRFVSIYLIKGNIMKSGLLISFFTIFMSPLTYLNAGTTLDYEEGILKSLLFEEKTVFLDYGTDWCITCASQKRTINALREEVSDYDKLIIFIYVDFDLYKEEPIVTDRKIPRRSTLVLLKGNKELGRLVAETSRRKIKDLLDIGLIHNKIK